MIELTWVGGEHSFELKIGQLRALQDACDAGPSLILERLTSGRWLVDDVIQTIRFGLEGGGMEKSEARKLTRMHVEEEPLLQHVPVAQAILISSLVGPEEDETGKSEAGGQQTARRSRKAA